MAFQLLDIIDLKKRYKDIDLDYYSFRTYLNRDCKTGVYKVVLCGLRKNEKMTIYGDSKTIKKKLKNLIEHLEETLETIELEESSIST